MEPESEDKTAWLHRHPWWAFFTLAALVFLAWLSYPNLTQLLDRYNENLAFEGTEALFTGLAFAGLIVTILQQSYQSRLQREELNLQRKELQLQRKEMEDSRGVADQQREEMKRQADTMQRQAFEATFFEMLRMHRSIVAVVHVNQHVGPHIFGEIINGMRQQQKEYHRQLNSSMSDQQRIRFAWSEFRKGEERWVIHVVRILVEVVLFVSAMSLPSDRQRYMTLLAAELTTNDLTLLFYYTIANLPDSDLENQSILDVKRAIEEYHIFRHLTPDKLAIPADANMFEGSAYNLDDRPLPRDIAPKEHP